MPCKSILLQREAKIDMLNRCAVGACLTSRTDLGMPEPAAEFFSMRAKTLLEIEMDSPTIATVQALVVMSASEAAFTRDARGWLYSGELINPKLYFFYSRDSRNGCPIECGSWASSRSQQPCARRSTDSSGT